MGFISACFVLERRSEIMTWKARRRIDAEVKEIDSGRRCGEKAISGAVLWHSPDPEAALARSAPAL
jgi:hypothetical protein